MIARVPGLPRTLTGKKLEVPVKRILQGARVSEVAGPGAVTNGSMLDWFAEFRARTDSSRTR
ncbi:hypothetical protein GCM10014715_42360 [Streptomyces spiralis]|uniref:Acetoacetyl-CoA synthetase n=1 Tax=Streptomyces spiralis TaxID=66376 RepID=A0A919DT57_9ACTN|nr:hypothetical protein [Streptomyces spiralis]GHE82135.1 hypothetical protein GCM10014715_42360 [Streptomyces spiralis]